MQGAARGSGAADGVVAQGAGALALCVVAELSLEVQLVDLDGQGGHHGDVCVVGDAGDVSENLDLVLVLDEAGLIQGKEELSVTGDD